MTNNLSLTVSERYARKLLAAWNSGELRQLQSALDWPDGAQAARLPSAERERIEMVQEIAGSIRLWLRGLNTRSQADLQASLRLLRHLARSEDTLDDMWMDDASTESPLCV
ncbi:MAG: hypothetical protein ABSB35_02535 [Bryobacteraceae bacterium]|jgi:hypothetical protein